MKNVVKGLLLAGLLTPVALNAFGIGVSAPVMTSVEHDVDGRSGTWKEDSISGLGLALDSNIGKNKLYNWRLNLEKNTIENKYGYEYDRTTIINTFGFSLFRNKMVRLFLGPRLEFGFINEDSWDGVDISLAPAVGVNINLGSTVSLGLDMDYKIAGLSYASRSHDGYGYSYGYGDDEKLSGLTTRLYLLFRLGERY